MIQGIIAGLTFFTTLAFAQTIPQGAVTPRYDPSREITIQGTVEETFTGTGRMRGMMWKVKAGLQSMTVILGPAAFIEGKKFAAALGDAVEVTGAPMPNRPDVIIAREVKKGETTLVLRDKQGRPEWGGQRRWKP